MLKHFQSNSYLFGGNAAYIEELYETYLDNPASVAEYSRDYFDALQNIYAANGARVNDIAHAPNIESFAQRAKHPAQPVRAGGLATAHKQVHVQTLIGAYRFQGALCADLDPIRLQERAVNLDLEPAFYGLTKADMEQSFHAANLYF